MEPDEGTDAPLEEEQGEQAEETFPEGALVFRTHSHAGAWTFDGTTYSDLCVVEDPSEDLIRAVAHAHAAGVIEIVQGVDTDALDEHGVQSQEDGEAAYAEAQGEWIEPVYEDVKDDDGEVIGQRIAEPGRWSGPWQEGHEIQAALDREARDRGEPTIVIEEGEE